MVNIREIQTRINSVKDTMKITNAMYMISSTKMRQAKKKLYKYDKTNHKLLYDIAWNYSYQLKDHKSAERYLQAFLKTRNKDAKKEEATAETGELVLGLENYYNAADKWLKDLQKEKFFNEGIPEQSPK